MTIEEIFRLIPPQFILPLIITAIVLIVVFIVNRFEKKRTAAMQNVAMQLGFSFEAKPENPPEREFPLFKKGYSSKAKNLISGNKRGTGLTIFDYTFTTGSGKNRSTHTQTVYLVKHNAEIPTFTLAPEGFFNKLSTFFGSQDIDFPENAEFSSKYHLKADDETTVKSFFSQSRLTFLTHEETFTIESDGKELLIYRYAKRTNPKELQKDVETVQRIAHQLQ